MEANEMVYCIEKDGEVYCNEYKVNSLLLKKGKPIMTSFDDYVIPRGLYSNNKLDYDSDKESEDDNIHYSGEDKEEIHNEGVINNDLYNVLLSLAAEPEIKRKKRASKGKKMGKRKTRKTRKN
jgi:hypothetical protein